MLSEQWKRFLSFPEVRLALMIYAIGLIVAIFIIAFFDYPEPNGLNAPPVSNNIRLAR